MNIQSVLSAEQCFMQAESLYNDGYKSHAERLFREILLEYPNHSKTNYNLGLIELEGKHVEASLPFFKSALEAEPKEEHYWLSYIRVLIQAKHYEDAHLVLSYGIKAGLEGKAIESLVSELDSKNHNSKLVLGDTPPTYVIDELINLFSEQLYEVLEDKMLTLVQQYPGWLVGWKILSDTLLVQGKDARLAALRALELNSDDAKEYCYYGLVLKSQDDLTGAAIAFEQAIKIRPDYAAAYNNLGIVKKDSGDVEGGIRDFRQAIKLNSSYNSCYSNLLFCLSHSESLDSKALFDEHRQFSEYYELPLMPSWPKHANKRKPERCIKIGFVSADFRDHSLAYFIEPLLAHLSEFKTLSLYAYHNSSLDDKITARLRTKFKNWNKVDSLSNEMLFRKILDDGIDILVDLDGHTLGNRLVTFAMKPAPVQVSWLGYLATTGLMAMDYYIADRFLLPPGMMDNQFTEKLVRLPANAPFMPSQEAPDTNGLPALKNGYITFACFNRTNKITHNTVRYWSALLKALPTSKMMLGAMPLQGSYDHIIEWFALEGVSDNRLILHPRSSIGNYLKLHHEVDICLDTYPSNGVTTTCHAAWMGVPTLCMEGECLSSRGALGVMKHVGLDGFVAIDKDDFIKIGLFWASHLENLAEVRATLRYRFEHSPLAQPVLIAKSLERAFRQMWQSWCDRTPAKSFEIKALDL